MSFEVVLASGPCSRHVLARHNAPFGKHSTHVTRFQKECESGWSAAKWPLTTRPSAHQPDSLQVYEPTDDEDDSDSDPEQHTYTIEVVTGSVRGAGTHDPATLQLFGARWEGSVYAIGDITQDNSQDTGFRRDSTVLYSITSRDLGALRRIHVIKSDGGHTELGSGWFLERITVTQPDNVKVTFPCHAWIGLPDDADDSTTGALPAVALHLARCGMCLLCMELLLLLCTCEANAPRSLTRLVYEAPGQDGTPLRERMQLKLNQLGTAGFVLGKEVSALLTCTHACIMCAPPAAAAALNSQESQRV